MASDFVYLASASPRRSELLRQIGVPFRIVAANVDESVAPDEAPRTYVERLARAKAELGWARAPSKEPVLAADTAVVIDGAILGKPRDRDEAAAMLLTLAGRTHEVLTAVALRVGSGMQSRLSASRVTLRPISAPEARAYWETGEASDKAGGYAVQGFAAVFIESLAGSYSGVMGLPLFETTTLLDAAGVPHWQRG